jgi:putative phosphoribosyl transferase
MRFLDRRSAGVLLGRSLVPLKPHHPVVMALPRGGVPVAFEVAAALECVLDVLLVRKVGLPEQPELAMGAVAEGGIVVRNEDVLALTKVSDDEFNAAVCVEQAELVRRAAAFRGNGERVTVDQMTAIIVDDGLATGSTALAGLRALRMMGAREVWVAVPVGPRDTLRSMSEVADRVVVLHQPSRFGSVGRWYRDFTQTTEDEVRALLAEGRLR